MKKLFSILTILLILSCNNSNTSKEKFQYERVKEDNVSTQSNSVSNNVIFLHDGLVEEEGHPDTVFTNPQSERCRNFLFNRRG